MPEPIGFRCKACGEGFVEQVLTDEEKARLRRENKKGGPITCPNCGSRDVHRV